MVGANPCVAGPGEKETLAADAMVTLSPALVACMAGELDRLRAGDARLVRMLGEARLRDVIDGDGLAPAGEPTETVGEWRSAGELTRLPVDCRQCLTLSEPLWESLLLLGEPGEDTITCNTHICAQKSRIFTILDENVRNLKDSSEGLRR